MTCICTEIDNSEFDAAVVGELRLPISLAQILDESYCVSIRQDLEPHLLELSLNNNEILSGLRNKMGIYHLWVAQDSCGDHLSMHRMLCAYVGKGQAINRVRSHIKNKWVKDEAMYVSYFECSNRVAKYLEQLFLDLYNFHLNDGENFGTKYLQTIWSEGRLVNGTQLHEHSEISAKKYPDIFNP